MRADVAQVRCMSSALSILLALTLGAAPSHAGASCSQEDDGDCCATDADCVAAVLGSICVVVPLNRIAAAKAGEHDPAISLCTRERVEELRGEAASTPVRCVQEICEFPRTDGE
jgi:hypothetical protein